MKAALLDLLRCAGCRSTLVLRDSSQGPREIEGGTLACTSCSRTFPISGGIPRFVPADNYSASFGLQWNLFRQAQLDSASGLTLSRDRFFASTRWTPEELHGRLILDVGCGSGRFAEIALSTGARVVAIDYSHAVDAARANLGTHPQFDVVQADIYQLPFALGSFDFVYCLGVLQHTPDVKRAFMSLVPLLAPGGRVAADFYPKLLRNMIWPKYWLRPLTSRLPPDRLFPLVKKAVPLLLPLSRVLGRAPKVGRWLRHAVPVSNYEGIYPLSEAQLKEWAVLDTFDMLSPVHDHPQSADTVAAWLDEAGLSGAEVFRPGHLVGRGEKPQAHGTSSA